MENGTRRGKRLGGRAELLGKDSVHDVKGSLGGGDVRYNEADERELHLQPKGIGCEKGGPLDPLAAEKSLLRDIALNSNSGNPPGRGS